MQQDSLLTRLRSIRKSRRLTITSVADGSGMEASHISRLERGVAGVSLESLQKYLSVCRYHLEIVPDEGSDTSAVHIGHLDAERQRAVRHLVYVLPDLPEALMEHLKDEINLWSSRYGGEKH